MQVKKRSGAMEVVNLDKILNSVQKVCDGLTGVDYLRIATKTVGGLYDGVTTKELDLLSIQTAVGFIVEDPIYGKVASHLLSNFIRKEVENQDIQSFSQSIQIGYDNGLISEETLNFVLENKRKLNAAIKQERNANFEYHGLKTVYERYLIKHPISRLVIESPQYWFMRVSCGLNGDVNEAIEMYNALSNFDYMTSTPTLFNSGTTHSQMSSCYLLDSPLDDLRDIYKRYQDVALLSKWAGGIGLNLSKIRSSGALIKGTNGKSNGITPWANTLDSSVSGVNQGGKRKGSACIYLETTHPDLLEFLEYKDNTGNSGDNRTYNLNLANWVPDLFMERVEQDGNWSFFDPASYPELNNLFGDEYRARYLELESNNKAKFSMPAKKIFARMMRTLGETGNGWMTWKDACNMRCNSAVAGHVVNNSNLCTEIVEPTSSGHYNYHTYEEIQDKSKNINVLSFDQEKNKFLTIDDAEVAVCNLASIILSNMVKDGKLDKTKLRKVTAIAVKNLDKVIDRNFYPIPEARFSNMKWRPVGLGVMGWQDLLFKLRIPFDSTEAINLAAEIQEEIYYVSLKTSMELAKSNGAHELFSETHAAKGLLQFDLAAIRAGYAANVDQNGEIIDYTNAEGKAFTYAPKDMKRWNELKKDIIANGLRNSLLIAIAPTATISQITGVYECIEPQQSNLFKRETLNGDLIQVNKYLVNELKALNLWDADMSRRILAADGSIRNILEIPQDVRDLYKTAWEIKQRFIIDQAAARGIYIDQAQSTNLFMSSPSIDKLSSMYMYAWKAGLKTTYYLFSEPATTIGKVGVSKTENTTTDNAQLQTGVGKDSIEVCESCQ